MVTKVWFLKSFLLVISGRNIQPGHSIAVGEICLPIHQAREITISNLEPQTAPPVYCPRPKKGLNQPSLYFCAKRWVICKSCAVYEEWVFIHLVCRPLRRRDFVVTILHLKEPEYSSLKLGTIFASNPAFCTESKRRLVWTLKWMKLWSARALSLAHDKRNQCLSH